MSITYFTQFYLNYFSLGNEEREPKKGSAESKSGRVPPKKKSKKSANKDHDVNGNLKNIYSLIYFVLNLFLHRQHYCGRFYEDIFQLWRLWKGFQEGI